MENLIGSFSIFLDKPFIVGDNVKVGAIEGRVETIGFRSTRIRGLDRMIVIVPNKKMTDAELMNDSERISRRARFSIELSNETSAEQMKAILRPINIQINYAAF
ncbi:MAG: mechanosensitive ion channel [Bacteroidetes bacterium]|nr:mechanosensitive ion channel [Bacteroidota bacterium]